MFKLAMVTAYPEIAGTVSGGVEGVAVCLAEKIAKETDWEVHVIAPSSTTTENHEIRNGVYIHWVNMSKIPGFLSYWSLYRRKVHRVLDELNPDITHFQGIAGWTLFYKKPYVLTMHGIIEKDVLHKGRFTNRLRYFVLYFIEKIARQKVRDVIIINQYVLDELEEQFSAKVWNISNPVQEIFFTNNRKLNIKRNKILYVGCISELKNIKGIILAFKELVNINSNVELSICGKAEDENYLNECQELIKDFGLSKMVKFYGNVDRADLINHLSTSACLVLLSKQEVAPMVVAESMAMGVPVVASNICGLPYMIDDTKNGFLVDSKEVSEVASYMNRLLVDDGLNLTMSEESMKYAQLNYHPDEVVKKTIHVYKSIIAENKK